MTFTGSQIEQITQSVLRELRSRGIASVSARTNGADHSTNGKPEATAVFSGSPDAFGLKLNERVITEAVLEAANAAGQAVKVPAGAVITPSGHDYIRRNAVRINGTTESSGAASDGVLISVGDCSLAKATAAATRWSQVVVGCEFDAAGKAVIAAKDRPVVCCGGEPSVTACLINRDRSLRAAVAGTNTDLDLLHRTMNPHVLCVEPSSLSFGSLQNLLRRMSRRTCDVPPGWKEVAGGRR